jgi:hypothetical protein
MVSAKPPTAPTSAWRIARVAYMRYGGAKRPLKKLLEHFGEPPLRLIDQASIEDAASALFPTHREVFTPVSAILILNGIPQQNLPKPDIRMQ